MRKILIIVFLAITGVIYALPIQVVTSFSILADVVKQVGGDKVKVSSIVGANQDIHDYELKPSDIVNINNSKLLIINGLGLEAGWINNIVKSYKGHIVTASYGINPLSMIDKQHLVKQDPHIWSNPINIANYYVPNILKALIAISPQNADYFIKNANKYTKELQELNCWVISQLNSIPINKRQIITTHDSFAYFAKQYNLKFLSAQGISTDSEATAQDIAKLEHIIKTSNVKVVFLENMTNNQLIMQIAKDTKATIGGKLYSDALSY
ncbi:MAG: metal ABC transporter solute-binding protein, Zn/Mn family, partial [Neisseriaceae bacterium]